MLKVACQTIGGEPKVAPLTSTNPQRHHPSRQNKPTNQKPTCHHGSHDRIQLPSNHYNMIHIHPPLNMWSSLLSYRLTRAHAPMKLKYVDPVALRPYRFPESIVLPAQFRRKWSWKFKDMRHSLIQVIRQIGN
jgi:hypothetical protein